MKSLLRLILVFALGLTLPLGYLVVQSYKSLAAEEAATLSFFAETLLDEIQEEAAVLIRREEARPIDAYLGSAAAALSGLPADDFILGYFQNNPDGGFQTPHRAPAGSPELTRRLAELEEANLRFNRKRAAATDRIPPAAAAEGTDERGKGQAAFAGRYILPYQRSKSHVSERQGRVETGDSAQPELKRRESFAVGTPQKGAAADAEALSKLEDRSSAAPAVSSAAPREGELPGIQAEVAPFQSVFLDDNRVFVFRRILIESRMHRQGFLLDLDAFLAHLIRSRFSTQPLAQFSHLRLSAADQGREARAAEAGPPSVRPQIALSRSFPAPFAFLKARFTSDTVPPSAARGTLNLAFSALAAVILAGLFAIYHSARKVVDFAERQARFVSSVTHELKTPLTNIRMYIEMLEQGMARDPEREQAYFRIVQSEGARLSRLITNVLELSRLERRHRRPALKEGDFAEVLAEVGEVMAEPLRQAGFVLSCDSRLTRPFRYDREIMVQVLINLIENSIKFGAAAPEKAIAIRLGEAGERVLIEVTDTGPGIPGRDLNKIFDDFYRAENAVTAAAGGTGIGLALVRRFAGLLGGRVSAANNPGAGCTIRIELPR
jgi:signal transduction histidine kinase